VDSVDEHRTAALGKSLASVADIDQGALGLKHNKDDNYPGAFLRYTDTLGKESLPRSCRSWEHEVETGKG